MENDIDYLNKWRLILGKYSKNNIQFDSDGKNAAGLVQGGSDSLVTLTKMEDVLDFLYSREYGEDNDIRESRSADMGESNLMLSDWINEIRELFPKQTVEIMERHALDNYGLTELLTDKQVLEKLEPNEELLKNILQLKGMMKGEVLDAAKRIVRKVAEDIMKRLETDIRKSIIGRIDKNKSSNVKSIRNIDMKKTIRNNLKNYNINEKRLYLDKIYFNSRVKKYNKWRVITAVDESGSMLASVIHSAVMAGIFAKLEMIESKIIIFDSNVVDLSGYVDDPVEVLMSVQLGGGTNISKALRYCETLIEAPQNTIVVLVSDLYEGGGYQNMYAAAASIIESGAKLIVLTALDINANPNYDKKAAAVLTDMGAETAAMTPEKLAGWIGKIMS